ncbi:unnamed protein product [Heligmosomoides polygyrus]|uniref:Alpha-galactosidase n=1 Tax=Heligmosomoides polygyrus TaxID=6339 RepID=A0A183GUP2_HELPZ|nr:unnamed protein product [Heligmosomoides polygyrus]
MCQLSHLKSKGFQTMWVDGAGKGQDYFKHGTNAYALCYSLAGFDIFDVPDVGPPNMMCIDGKWIQTRGKGNCF